MKLFLLFNLFIFCSLFADDITVTINTNSKLLTSRFFIGTTHTHGFWEYGHHEAVGRAKELLINGVAFQNQHIMGWGAGNPNLSPGEYNWNDLDHRINLMREIDTPMFITFCQAPGWMKGTGDWEMEQEVLDEYVNDFANLCSLVAERFKDVEYFQVWNELKGYWNSSLNNWDYKRYTEMYNTVYNAVKTIRPDAKIGGPYIVIQGDGATEIGKSGRDTHLPIDSRDRTFLNYWLNNKAGADFICADYGLIDYHDTNTYTHDEKMSLTRMFGKWISDLANMTDLPIVISEFYGGADEDDLEFTAANYASCYYHALTNGASIALTWNPEQGEVEGYLFTDTDKANGGSATPHYNVVKSMNDYFPAGTDIVTSLSSSEWLEVLASAQKTMLINKRDDKVTVNVNGQSVSLDRYEVKIIDTPFGSGIEQKPNFQGSSSIEKRYTPNGPEIHIMPPYSQNVTVQVYNILGQSVQEFSQSLLAHTRNIIRLFENTKSISRGIYFVHIKGLESPMVQQITLK